MTQVPEVTLSTGAKLPMLAYGTGTRWMRGSNDEVDRKTVDGIKEALALGYRHLDGAQVYNTETEMGIAIEESGIPRSDIWITTKVWLVTKDSTPVDIEEALRTSLKKLKTDYVDLYLIHEPFSSGTTQTLQDHWKAMERCQAQGLARQIGVSNFQKRHLETVLEVATTPPVVNQFELHAYLQSDELVQYMVAHKIAVEAYAPLTPITKYAPRPGPVDGVCAGLAAKYGVSEAAVLLRWVLERGFVAVTTSGRAERLREYLERVPGFRLGADEVEEISTAGREAGADVYMSVRDAAKGEQAVREILAADDEKVGKGKLETILMDLGSLESVRAGAKNFLEKSGNKLNILINNAGIMACPRGKTQDGFELQFGTNHLGRFLLFNLVKEALLASATPAFNSRVISVASAAHRTGKIDVDDLWFERHREYTPLGAYDQSKLANILFANELDRRYKSQNLRALSLHPGGILTPLTRYLPQDKPLVPDDPMPHAMLKSPAQGAATTVWGAVAGEWEGKGGVYLDEVAEGWITPADAAYYAGGYAARAFDPETERRLWDVSLKLTGLSD